MTHDQDRAHGVAAEEERDLTLVAMLVGIIIVAGGIFILNSTTAQYNTASYRAPAALNNVPIMTPDSAVTKPPVQ